MLFKSYFPIYFLVLLVFINLSCKPHSEPQENQTNASSDTPIAITNDATPKNRSFIIRVKTIIPNADVHIVVSQPKDEKNNFMNTYDLNCGNGEPTHMNQSADILCQFSSPGEYDISLSGKLFGIQLVENEIGNQGWPYHFIDIKQWGDIEWHTMDSFANGCSELNISASDVPNLSHTGSMDNMFSYSNMNSPINHWNVSSIKTMHGVFQGNYAFNQPLDKWDVSNVTDMSSMFESATNFNQPINRWNVTRVRNMKKMFYNASKFNQPLDRWNVKNVENMKCMFNWAESFQQDISSWDFSSIAACLSNTSIDDDEKECIEYIFSFSEERKSPLKLYQFLQDRFPNGYIFSDQDDGDESLCL